MDNKVLIFSAPSGAGKSTIVGHILGIWKDTMEFSISATSRAPRGTEQNGREYHFVSPDEFRRAAGHVIIFDVDVKGGVNLKKYFGEKALSIFIKAPSVETLRQRLVKRGTDSPEAIAERVEKASQEMEYAPQFDYVLINDDLATAFGEVEKVVEDFLDDGRLNYSTFI